MSDRNRYNVLWAPGKAGEAHGQAKAHGLKHIPYDRIDADTDWRVYEIPPGIAKKEEEWIRKHPHFGGVFEPEGFGTLIHPVNVEVVPPLGEVGSALAVAEGTEWWQTFVGAPQAWAVTRGLGAIGAITDNGLGPHPFTDPRLVETKIFDATETEPFGGSHGNPVTGCAVGIAPLCGVTNYKIAGTDVKCSWTDVSNAWLHAKAMGRKAVNTSYGGGTSLMAAGTAATLRQAGIAIICAAGNSGDATQFPANNANCYAVSALDEGGNIAGFSCRGKIDICAPGSNLLTTTSGGGWAKFSGTSGAAPIATGMVLLICAQNPSWTGVQAMERLMATATPKLPREHYGAGLPNVARAVGAESVPLPPDVPPPPTGVPAVPGAPTISEVTASGYLAKVSPVLGATGYKWFQQGKGSLWAYEFQTTTLPEARRSGLPAGAEAQISALAFNAIGKSARGPATVARTLSGDAPAPVETWTQKSAESVVRSPYSPAQVEQSRTVTTTTLTWEESNLGNRRNETSTVDTATETRTVLVPVN